MTMKLWGGNYEASPDAVFWEFNRSFPFDRRLVHEEIAASRAWVRALGRCGAIKPDEAAALERGLDEVVARLAADPKYIEADVEDVHSFVEERLRRDRGRARRAGPPGPQPQRADGDGAAALLEERDRRARGRHRTARGCARRAGPLRRRRRDARLHPHARGGADHLRLLGRRARLGPGARPRAPAGRARARRRAAARLGRPGRRVAPARPRGDGEGPRLRGHLPRRARRRDGPRLRGRARLLLRPAPDPPRPNLRGPHPLRGARVRLRAAAGGVHHRLVADAAEEEPRCARARAWQGRARRRRAAAAPGAAQGPAGRLPEGPAGGQGGRLRRGRHRDGLGRRDDRGDRRPRHSSATSCARRRHARR